MLILVHSAPVSVLRDLGGVHPNVGILSSPRRVYSDTMGLPWAADNDAFLAWDPDLYLRMLETISEMDGCLFVTAPDVVGDADRTLELWGEWRPRLDGLPACLVAQDGLTVDTVPWDELSAVFIGGTSEWKMSSDAAAIVSEANSRGVWTHMGRVNGNRRILWAKSIGCRSIDGSGYSKFRQLKLAIALEAASMPEQLNFITSTEESKELTG